MNERLSQINRGLHALDEAYHGGRIDRADYRARRRRLLGTLCDSHGITARHAVDARTASRDDTLRGAPHASPMAGNDALSTLLRAGSGLAWRSWLAFGAVIVLAVVTVYFLLG